MATNEAHLVMAIQTVFHKKKKKFPEIVMTSKIESSRR